jgi:hypothetical protein
MLDHYTTIKLTDNKLYFYYFNDEEKNEEYDITWETINKIQYITFNYDGQFLDIYGYRPVSKGMNRFLILYGDNDDRYSNFFYLYNNNNELVFRQLGRIAANIFYPPMISINATSELKEGNIAYTAQNLLEEKILLPWAENSKGPGIGEKIFLEYNTTTGSVSDSFIQYWAILGISISNGFVDYNRPYLYENNNRIKKIRIYFNSPDDFMDIELEDTPQIQHFHFFEKRNANIQLEILDIYKGDKWDDTCINNIFPFADSITR